jgi:LysM repeat protein
MDANESQPMWMTRFRGLTLGILALLAPWGCWELTNGLRVIPGRAQFSTYVISGASWLLLACSCWAAALLLAVLIEEIGGLHFRGAPLALVRRSCPPAVRRFVLAWCGLAISTSLLAPAQAAVPNPAPAPLPSIGRVVATQTTTPEQTYRLQPVAQTNPGFKSVTVRSGDSLWRLAQHHLGDGRRWPEIHHLNKTLIKDPDLIEPGWKLRLPIANSTVTPTTAEGTK